MAPTALPMDDDPRVELVASLEEDIREVQRNLGTGDVTMACALLAEMLDQIAVWRDGRGGLV